ncbi:MAG: hypothetical protein LBT40_06460 [Deltaproteobacteria bacterium]|nr:hypothetical protein [Deltaproteobacteria bacterium]
MSNLALACQKCNQKKADMDLDVFLKKDPDLAKMIQARLLAPLTGAAVMNATRNVLARSLKTLPVTAAESTGGQTRFNRTRLGIPKTHALDRVFAGPETGVARGWETPTVLVRRAGR